jgi:hypothetical protein
MYNLEHTVTDDTVDVGFYSRWFYLMKLFTVLKFCTVTVLIHSVCSLNYTVRTTGLQSLFFQF